MDYSKYTRWLWWLLIIYMFYAQATICDEYFVESIKATASGFLALCGVKRCLGDTIWCQEVS